MIPELDKRQNFADLQIAFFRENTFSAVGKQWSNGAGVVYFSENQHFRAQEEK